MRRCRSDHPAGKRTFRSDARGWCWLPSLTKRLAVEELWADAMLISPRMSADLPLHVQAKVDQLRSRGGQGAKLVELLLQKRSAATLDEERNRYDNLILELARPSRAKYFVGVVLAFVVAMVGHKLYSEYRIARAVEAGARTVARVKRLEDANCLVGYDKSRCMKVTLDIFPQEGAPYAASLEHDIGLEWMSRVQPGSYVFVAVSRSNPAEIYLDEDALAVPPPAPPAPSK